MAPMKTADIRYGKECVRDVREIRCFVLDMDGTFYLGNRLLPGSFDFIGRVRETDRSFVFLTNNSSKSADEYIRKLERMGLSISSREMVTSGQATIRYLNENHKGESVYLLGNPALASEFREQGITLTDVEPDLVVTAFDTTLDYAKMCRVCDLVREGRPYLATHPDYNCPTENGYVPDIGAIHAFIHVSTGRMPDRIIGKPYREIMDCALFQAGCTAGEAAMVGDRLYTDIAITGNVPGLRGILVLSGEAEEKDIAGAPVKPHMVFGSLMDITPLL